MANYGHVMTQEFSGWAFAALASSGVEHPESSLAHDKRPRESTIAIGAASCKAPCWHGVSVDRRAGHPYRADAAVGCRSLRQRVS